MILIARGWKSTHLLHYHTPGTETSIRFRDQRNNRCKKAKTQLGFPKLLFPFCRLRLFCRFRLPGQRQLMIILTAVARWVLQDPISMAALTNISLLTNFLQLYFGIEHQSKQSQNRSNLGQARAKEVLKLLSVDFSPKAFAQLSDNSNGILFY